MKVNNKRDYDYIVMKYLGGSANCPAAKNIEIELEDGYEFGEITVAGKPGYGIRKIKN